MAAQTAGPKGYRTIQIKKKEAFLLQLPESTHKQLMPFIESLFKLEGSIVIIPQPLQASVRSICQTTQKIILCMGTDPNDMEPGSRFLHRYLKAVHTIVGEHSRLESEAPQSQRVQKVLAQSKQTLARLERAFIREYDSLLHNDVINFTAELKALDTLFDIHEK